jgi:hypothetical protein
MVATPQRAIGLLTSSLAGRNVAPVNALVHDGRSRGSEVSTSPWHSNDQGLLRANYLVTPVTVIDGRRRHHAPALLGAPFVLITQAVPLRRAGDVQRRHRTGA